MINHAGRWWGSFNNNNIQKTSIIGIKRQFGTIGGIGYEEEFFIIGVVGHTETNGAPISCISGIAGSTLSQLGLSKIGNVG